MTVSLRLDKELNAQIEEAARRAGISKSEFIRRCLTDHLATQRVQRLPWELGKDVFGRAGSGRSDLSQNGKQIMRERLTQQVH